MKVKTLIKLLKKYKPDEEIRVWGTVRDDGDGWLDIGNRGNEIKIDKSSD